MYIYVFKHNRKENLLIVNMMQGKFEKYYLIKRRWGHLYNLLDICH